MCKTDFSDSRLSGMAEVLGGQWKQPRWKPEELGAILKHQLAAGVQDELGVISAAGSRKPWSVDPFQVPPLRTFSDLLAHPHPPLELLKLTKLFAKEFSGRPDSPLPDEIGRILYLASIILALLRCGERITALDDDALRAGVHWALEQSWLDDGTRRIFLEGRDFLLRPAV